MRRCISAVPMNMGQPAKQERCRKESRLVSSVIAIMRYIRLSISGSISISIISGARRLLSRLRLSRLFSRPVMITVISLRRNPSSYTARNASASLQIDSYQEHVLTAVMMVQEETSARSAERSSILQSSLSLSVLFAVQHLF